MYVTYPLAGAGFNRSSTFKQIRAVSRKHFRSELFGFTSDFDSHWMPYSYGLVPYLSKMFSKYLLNSLVYQD